MSDSSSAAGGCAIFGLVALAGWVTHIVICFKEEHWGFLIAGALFVPIGVFHGIGRWFGFW